MALNGVDARLGRKRKVIGFGPPKGAGKTTFYNSAPGETLILQFDLGSTSIPPMKRPEEVHVQCYADPGIERAAFDLNMLTDKWKRSAVVYKNVIKDIGAIIECFKKGLPEIRLYDGTIVPRPENLILDGMVRLDEIIIDAFLDFNNASDPGEILTPKGASMAQQFWGKRLRNENQLLTLLISCPINVFGITWANTMYVKDDKGQPTTTIQSVSPDLGGKLAITGPGKFDSCLYHYHEGGLYKVRTKPTPTMASLGIRDDFVTEAVVDVTISREKATAPFGRVFK